MTFLLVDMLTTKSILSSSDEEFDSWLTVGTAERWLGLQNIEISTAST